MQFQVTTDYAIRIVLYLYHNRGELSTASDISEKMGITYQYQMKIIKKLLKAGLVESVQGRKGGYCLGKTANDVNLYEIISVMEGEVIISRCLEEDEFCSRNYTEKCSVRKVLKSLQKELAEKLKGIKVSELD